MKNNWKKFGALFLVATLLMTLVTVPVLATETVTFVMEDITGEGDTMMGEAKIKVSVQGNVTSANTIQAAFTFQDSDLLYYDTDYFLGSDNLNEGKLQETTGEGSANSAKALTATVISINEPVALSGDDAVFVFSFIGNPGDSVTLVLDPENSYVKTGNTKLYAAEGASETAVAATEALETTQAQVELEVNKVSGFTASEERPITVDITNQRTGKTVHAIVKDENRTGISPLTYLISRTVIKEDFYTVEISGNGYIPFKVTDYSFTEMLKVDNDSFIPGDVDGDEDVDGMDKALYLRYVEKEQYSAKADFNCDGRTDDLDDVFEGIVAEELPPEEDYEEEPGDDNAGDDNAEDNTGDDNDDTTGDNTGSGDNTGGTAGGGTAGGGAAGGGAAGGGAAGGGAAGGGAAGGGAAGGGAAGGGGFSGGSVAAEAFTDLEGFDWAKDSIYTLKNKGVISGVSETEYAPSNNIKRGDFILILTRMLGITGSSEENFADVPADSYYFSAISAAKAAGIATGDGVNFMPENSITRQDLITLAYRAFLTKGYITETDDLSVLDAFGDKGSISDYAMTSMASMVGAGIIQGSDGSVNPLGNATRAEVAVMCARLLALMN